jgi:hypothetical protein
MQADMETTHQIATAAATAAASAVAGRIRTEMQDSLAHFESNIAAHIESQFTKHFGSMDPTQHIIQHNRLETYLKRIDDMQSGFWKGIAGTVAKYVVIGIFLAAGAWFAWGSK